MLNLRTSCVRRVQLPNSNRSNKASRRSKAGKHGNPIIDFCLPRSVLILLTKRASLPCLPALLEGGARAKKTKQNRRKPLEDVGNVLALGGNWHQRTNQSVAVLTLFGIYNTFHPGYGEARWGPTNAVALAAASGSSPPLSCRAWCTLCTNINYLNSQQTQGP